MRCKSLYLTSLTLISVASAAGPWLRHRQQGNLATTTTDCSGESCAYPQSSSSACFGESCPYPQYSSSAVAAPVWPQPSTASENNDGEGDDCDTFAHDVSPASFTYADVPLALESGSSGDENQAYPQSSSMLMADVWPATTSAAVYSGLSGGDTNEKAAIKPIEATVSTSAAAYNLPIHRVPVNPPNGASPSNSGTESLIAIPDNSSDTTSSIAGASVSRKKGAGVWAVKNLTEMVTKIGATWAYAWSEKPENAFTAYGNGSLPSNVDLVAMINSTSDFKALSSSEYKEIVGYNEPDVHAAPVTWEDAATQWPQIVATGKRIGSPAPANTKLVHGDWFYEFMANITAAGSHVDFICLHYYSPDGDVANFQKYIEGVYKMYKKPIWVTEWAYVDYSKDPVYVPSDTDVLVTYLKAAVAMLESLNYVERYAWFAMPWSSVQPATNMFDEFGNITPVGTAYSAL